MNIRETKMEGNLYNKHDSLKWMTIPRLSEIPKTSFLNVNNLVFFDESLLKNAGQTLEKKKLSEMFEEI